MHFGLAIGFLIFKSWHLRRCVVRENRAPARVSFAEQAAALAAFDADRADGSASDAGAGADNNDDEYEDVSEEDDQPGALSRQPCSRETEGSNGAFDLSMIMEQSYVDADFNLCLSGMQFDYINTVLTIGDLLSHSEYDLFVKTSISGHSLRHLLPP